MRTTVELPAELLRAAKAEAATRGETLKQFLTRAVAHELGNAAVTATHGRVRLPLVESARQSAVEISNTDIEEVFAAEDAEQYGSH